MKTPEGYLRAQDAAAYVGFEKVNSFYHWLARLKRQGIDVRTFRRSTYRGRLYRRVDLDRAINDITEDAPDKFERMEALGRAHAAGEDDQHA